MNYMYVGIVPPERRFRNIRHTQCLKKGNSLLLTSTRNTNGLDVGKRLLKVGVTGTQEAEQNNVLNGKLKAITIYKG